MNEKGYGLEMKEVTIILSRDKETLERWMKAYSGLIFTICYSMTGDYFQSEDLAQETFVSAYRAMGSFDGKNEKAWLVKIASNKCRDYLKSSARRMVPSEDQVFDAVKDTSPLPEEEVIGGDLERRLQDLCDSLREPYRTVATEYFIHRKHPEQIARQTGTNVKTVQTQFYRARAMLHRLWKEEQL